VEPLDLARLQGELKTSHLGRSVVYRPVTTSTMDLARREAEEGATSGTIVLTEEQTTGRGRFGRTWVSPPGANTYVTLVLRPSPDQLRVLPVAAPLAVARALRASGAEPTLKWPNDVQLDGLKVAGILLESEWLGGDPVYTLAGIGINVNFDATNVAEIAGIATSMRTHLGREVPREPVLAAVLNELESILDRADQAEILSEYRPLVTTIGQQVQVSAAGETVSGVAEGIDQEGRLLVRTASGVVQAFAAGEVTLRAPGNSE
jgi:BirA family biotin operon repressor/biotin-[acetyl-CoA-carboxylase] ligase